MNELGAQKLLVDAVNTHGGVALKMNNKFLKGVPDALVMIKKFGTSLWECKIHDWPKNDRKMLKVEPTELQKLFLQKFSDRGGRCGVISFVRGKTDLLMAAIPYKVISYGDADVRPFWLDVRGHNVVKRGERLISIYEILERTLNEEEAWG